MSRVTNREREMLINMCKVLILTILALAGACSPSRHLHQGQYLLDRVDLEINDSTGVLTSKTMMPYVHQRPNNKFLHISRLRLGVYNMSGKDSTNWWNKWLRKLGEAPVIYTREAAQSDSTQLLRAMRNAGFMGASVKIDSAPDATRKSIKLKYILDAGIPHTIESISYDFPNDTLREAVMRDSDLFIVQPGNRLDRNELEEQRELITSRLRNRGYWAFTKEFITFSADTTEGSHLVDLTMSLRPPYPDQMKRLNLDTHKVYRIGKVSVVTDYLPPGAGVDSPYQQDTLVYRDLNIIYANNKKYLNPETIYENVALQTGSVFRQRDIDRTYQSFGRLPIIKFIQVKTVPSAIPGVVDTYILLTPGKSQTISLELEGTNSEGDLGVAASVNYSHRNLGNSSSNLDFKLRGSYQALNGKLENFIHNHYVEAGFETAFTIPKFLVPFLNDNFKKRVRASTEFHISSNYQERPEFTRLISA
ncbi:MAG: outer membrane protein assembly factor, partial [Muribaculaceae bacterium]|nr:outer membrane protein assembly factor [Muribaculaceae bacterium]